MSDISPLLSLPYLLPAQAQKHVTHNEALDLLDMLVQPVVEGVAARIPPASPVEGALWALGPEPTGLWAGQGLCLASWRNGAWMFAPLRPGWMVFDRAAGASLAFDGTGWQPAVGDLQNLAGLGIGTTWDAVSRLAVAADATLLTHAGGGHQLKINKAAAAETASLLFQTGWSGRAEIGTVGEDGLSIKVSADGATFVPALLARSDQLRIDLPLTGAAVQADALDATPARVMTTGAFGLGMSDGLAAPSDDADLCLKAGLAYRLTPAALHAPATEVSGGSLLVSTGAGGSVQQLFLAAGGARLWLRGLAAGASLWGVWQRILGNDLILGPVAQAAGVPTGALFETGSNANGSWTRFADGTQICTGAGLSAPNISTAEGTIFRSADVVWSFPAGFVGAPVVSGAAEDLQAWLSAGLPGTTSCTVRLKSAVSKASSVGLRLMAQGRWF